MGPVWFQEIVKPGEMADIPVSFGRSVMLASVVSLLTVTFSIAAALAFRRRFPGFHGRGLHRERVQFSPPQKISRQPSMRSTSGLSRMICPE